MLDPLVPFGLRTARRRHELSIPGSPERCVSRSVLEDTSGRLWLLEQLAARQAPQREAIAGVLSALHEQDASWALPFHKSQEGGFSATLAGLRWQLSPFLLADDLPRPEYLEHASRGLSLARVMLDFKRRSAALPEALTDQLGPALDLPGYAQGLLQATRAKEPGVHAALEAFWPNLEAALAASATLPVRLQHGDLHPLNVLWRGGNADAAALALIDWEFLGRKPECYDLANLLGCLGFEHPDGLTGPLALALTSELRRNGYLCNESWNQLPRFTALLRLAWLSEWLRKGERDLVEMELEYMGLLLEREAALRCAWRMAC